MKRRKDEKKYKKKGRDGEKKINDKLKEKEECI